ncbi:MAG: hypothetical protein KAQ68_07075 [Clostridiales bacterium]|nr:hypothetical protein [Clostridiales bacterium]
MNNRTINRHEEIIKIVKDGGYLLNPDQEITIALIDGLVKNEERYGEEICPCRLYKGDMSDNLDIVCPCYYRDDDLAEFGSCFCGLFVTHEVSSEGGPTQQTPERRPSLEDRKKSKNIGNIEVSTLPYPVYRCSVCGYLCANTNAPHVCPICRAKKERFERFV